MLMATSLVFEVGSELCGSRASRVVSVSHDLPAVRSNVGESLPAEVSTDRHAAAAHATPRGGTFRQAMRDAEATIVREAIERYGSQTQAARHLGLGQPSISRKLKKLGLR
jgi:transcriptional regulator with PAS, ATPase and Fis domain